MKRFFLVLSSIIVLLLSFACNNSSNESKKENETVLTEEIDENTISVYYFHGDVRCNTCIAIDETTHKYLKELFPEKMKNGEIIFRTYNLDQNERADLIKKHDIYGQTMLFIKGDKVINETDAAFQYVTAKPEKWKKIVEDRIYELTN